MNDDNSFPPPEGNPYDAGHDRSEPDAAPSFQAPAPPPPAWEPFAQQAPPPAGVPSPAASQAGPYATQTLPTQPRPDKGARRGRLGFAAAVVAAALVVGGGAGIGGAAIYQSSSDEDGGSSSSSGPVTTSQVADTPDKAAADGSVEQVAAAVLPSVVKLDVGNSQEAGSGSGIILSSDGLILTNNHVAELGEDGTITVSFNDGTHADASIVGRDPLTDTALVQAKDVEGLTPATIGKSANVDVGEQVVAVGSPFGLDATVTSGIVSALNRPVDVGSDGQGNSTTYPAIQTDAAINPGNSGGPLVDLDGNVIGINSSIQSNSTSAGGEAGSIGLGFAIPIDEVEPVIEQMKDGETPTHARLGISVGNVASQDGALVTDGAQVQDVSNGSAAGQAGLENGDVITKIDDTLITGADSLVATVRSYQPGDDVTVTYERDGQEKTTTLTLDSDEESSNS